MGKKKTAPVDLVFGIILAKIKERYKSATDNLMEPQLQVAMLIDNESSSEQNKSASLSLLSPPKSKKNEVLVIGSNSITCSDASTRSRTVLRVLMCVSSSEMQGVEVFHHFQRDAIDV